MDNYYYNYGEVLNRIEQEENECVENGWKLLRCSNSPLLKIIEENKNYHKKVRSCIDFEFEITTIGWIRNFKI